MSIMEDWYVNSIDALCYVEFSQSLIVKYFIAVKFFSLLSKTFKKLEAFLFLSLCTFVTLQNHPSFKIIFLPATRKLGYKARQTWPGNVLRP